MTTPALLEIHALSKIYGNIPVVDRVSLNVTRGEIVMVIGPRERGNRRY